MKTIYKSLMTIAFAGLSLASCDKELKEETAMEVGVVTDSNVSFDGKTVTVKKGSPVTFSFDGDPDFISFFSGEPSSMLHICESSVASETTSRYSSAPSPVSV